jgi:hypothetical protein
MRQENCDNDVVRSKQALRHAHPLCRTAVENQHNASFIAHEDPFRLKVRNMDCVHPIFKKWYRNKPILLKFENDFSGSITPEQELMSNGDSRNDDHRLQGSPVGGNSSDHC